MFYRSGRFILDNSFTNKSMLHFCIVTHIVYIQLNEGKRYGKCCGAVSKMQATQ